MGGWKPLVCAVAASLVVDAASGCHCGDCSRSGGYVVSPGDGVERPLALYSGWRDGACWDDFACFGTCGKAGLGDVRWNDSCASEALTVFAPGRAPHRYLRDLASARTLALASPVPVPLTIWIVSEENALPGIWDDRAGRHVARALRLYQELDAGVRLEFNSATDVHRIDPARFEELMGATSYAYCDNAPRLQTPHFAAADRINVYYVPVIYSFEHGGLACGTEPEAIFVEYLGAWSANLLAHEIGHSLGLVKPRALAAEPGEIDGFPDAERNLMTSSAAEVRSLTLGQVFRIHFDADGWLGGRATDVQGGLPTCQDDAYTRAPCPPLTLTAPGGWR